MKRSGPSPHKYHSPHCNKVALPRVCTRTRMCRGTCLNEYNQQLTLNGTPTPIAPCLNHSDARIRLVRAARLE